ncbi:MarR family winged helix-turn-helix transcriptional regulator [Streptomyces sp. CB03238]|uniref:MarR family winged helix-turn-helix transcriptional regulator n=1 Tax=Streptomyces sp. CB03238 TaxID=1907777 RepID=UPI000A0F6CF6|nr:MarR family winged helix-turn-helix transcriptional regulator [Streptomyces sp. CB03238]ORT59447.1 MarR family transcriptional regulator [Streptomyces sp. CB03238]
MAAADGNPAPTDRLGFVLAWRGELAGARIRRALGVTGLPPRQAMTLMHLAAGPTSQRALADTMEVDPSQLVAILNDLEGAGLAERRRDPADRRRHIVEITDKGATTLREVDTALNAAERELFAALSERDRASLRTLLERLSGSREGLDCSEE